MCNLCVVFSELVWLFCVVFSSSNFSIPLHCKSSDYPQSALDQCSDVSNINHAEDEIFPCLEIPYSWEMSGDTRKYFKLYTGAVRIKMCIRDRFIWSRLAAHFYPGLPNLSL